ncbi:MAG: CRP-like cAMP-binding protein [Planctomycetota bacterium]|jgi:CRP-like cAMP-binding protein
MVAKEKGPPITTIGRYTNLEYFMIKGTCKSFLYTPEGEDVTITFFMSGSIISPSTTRNREGKSIINMCALADVEIATINADEFEKLMIEDLEIRHFGNEVLRTELVEKVEALGVPIFLMEDFLVAAEHTERMQWINKETLEIVKEAIG